MYKSVVPPGFQKSGLDSRVDDLRSALRAISPDLLAGRTGSIYKVVDQGRGEFRLSLFSSPLILTFPELIAYNERDDPHPLYVQALTIYYFYTADGASLHDNWISFAELPDGRIYDPAFQGYSGNEIVKAFGLDIEKFRRACEKEGGQERTFGDAAYSFQALPRLPLLVNYWCGDEDFPSTCKILFNESARHYLPTDVAAILGGMLARRLVRAAV